MPGVAIPQTATPQHLVPKPFDAAQYHGKVIYLDFWASWCGPCKVSFRYMNQLRASYLAADLVIITVNLDRDKAAAANFLSATNTNLPVVYDPKGAIASQYKVAGMPTTILIGRDGRQRFVHNGYFEAKNAEYTAHVASLVAEAR